MQERAIHTQPGNKQKAKPVVVHIGRTQLQSFKKYWCLGSPNPIKPELKEWCLYTGVFKKFSEWLRPEAQEAPIPGAEGSKGPDLLRVHP